MKKFLIGLIFTATILPCTAQEDPRITTIDFVQILDDHYEEAMHYYLHNWKELRIAALEAGYIQEYELLEVPASDDQPFHLLLVTTYANEAQYGLRENHFGALIGEQGALNLLNELEPGAFRRVVFSKEMVRHR